MTSLNYNGHKALVFLILLSGLLIFSRLGENALQTDEGSDSFYSLTILKYGYPSTSNGINEFGQTHSIDGKWKQQPWFPFYVRALSLYMFGQNSFAARLPSALLGVLSAALLYLLTFRITRSKKEAFIASLLLACSVPLLLYFRTARYIAFEAPLTILIILFYIQMLEYKKWSAVGFAASSILLFHSMYVECAGVLFGITLHLLFFERSKQRLKQFFAPFIIIFLFTAPWILYIYPVFELVNSDYAFRTGNPYKLSLMAMVGRFGAFVFQINNFIFPIIFLCFLPGGFYKKKFLIERKEFTLLAIVIVSTICVSTLNFIPLQQYIAGILPLFYIFTARIICILRSIKKPAIMTTVIGLLIFTNVFNVGPLYPFKAIDNLLDNKITGALRKIDFLRGPISVYEWQVEFKSVFSEYL